MSTKKKFRPEEVEELRANPYTEKVSEEQISFTLAFKEVFWHLSVEGCTGDMAFRKLMTGSTTTITTDTSGIWQSCRRTNTTVT